MRTPQRSPRPRVAGLSLALMAVACFLLMGHAPGAAEKKLKKMNAHFPHPGHDSIVWGTASQGLRLGLMALGTTLQFHLQNVGPKPVEVFSHVEAGEKQYEWYTVHLKDAHGHSRTLAFVADRDESWRVTSHLDAGGRLENAVDLAAWAQQPINGDQPLAPGVYEAAAVYEVTPEEAMNCWSGRLEAGPVKLIISDK